MRNKVNLAQFREGIKDKYTKSPLFPSDGTGRAVTSLLQLIHLGFPQAL